MGIFPVRSVRKKVLVLAGAFLLLLLAAAHGQPLAAKESLTIRFIPVLVAETAGEGYADGITAYSSGVTFRRVYRVLPEGE